MALGGHAFPFNRRGAPDHAWSRSNSTPCAEGGARHERKQRLFSTSGTRMVTDVQLAIFANMLGVSLFLLVVLYHYVAVNNPKKQD